MAAILYEWRAGWERGFWRFRAIESYGFVICGGGFGVAKQSFYVQPRETKKSSFTLAVTVANFCSPAEIFGGEGPTCFTQSENFNACAHELPHRQTEIDKSPKNTGVRAAASHKN